MVVILDSQNYYLLTLSIRSLSGKRPKSVSGKSFSCRFSLARNANTKATEQVTFGFYFPILVFFTFQESLNLTVYQRLGFFGVLAAIIQESSDKLPCIENRKGFAVHSSTEWHQRRVTFQQLIAISTHVKKYVLYNTAVYVINFFF